MKKLIAFLLAVCVLLGCACADISTTSVTQLDKLTESLEQSGLKARVLFSASGSAPEWMDQTMSDIVFNILPTLNVNFSYTPNIKYSHGSEVILTVQKNKQEVTHFDYLTDGQGISYLRSPLFDDQKTFYAAENSFDVSGLISDALQSGEWPSIYHILYMIETAPASWQERFEKTLDVYKMSVTAWMQNYAKTETEADLTGGFITTMTYQIPANAVLMELKQLLVDFMADSSIRTLLREILSPAESAAYLQQVMLVPFLQMVDNIELSGEITVNRQFDGTGTELSESLYLPFPENNPLESITVVLIPGEGMHFELTAQLRPEENAEKGISLNVTAESDEAGIYTGDVTLRLPDDPNDYSVAPEGHPGYTEKHFAYNLFYAEPLDTADPFNNFYQRAYEASLLIKPDDFAPQSLAFKGLIYSKSSSKRSPSYIEVYLTWTDSESDATATMSVAGMSQTAWTPTMLEEAQQSAIRVDLLDADEQSALAESVVSHALAMLLGTPELTAPEDTAPTVNPIPTIPPEENDDGSLG